MQLPQKILLPIHTTLYERVSLINTKNKYKKKPEIALRQFISSYQYIPIVLPIKERHILKSPEVSKIPKKRLLFFIKNRVHPPNFKTALKKVSVNIISSVYLKQKPLGIIYNPFIRCAERVIIEFDILEYISTKDLQSSEKKTKSDIKGSIYLNLYNCNNTEATGLAIKYGLKTIYEKSDVLMKYLSKKIYVSELKGSLDTLLKKIVFTECL